MSNNSQICLIFFSTILCSFCINAMKPTQHNADKFDDDIDLNRNIEWGEGSPPASPKKPLHIDLNEPPALDDENEQEANHHKSANNDDKHDDNAVPSPQAEEKGKAVVSSERDEPSSSIMTSSDSNEQQGTNLNGAIPKKARSKRPRKNVRHFELQKEFKLVIPKRNRSKKASNENDQKTIGEDASSSSRKNWRDGAKGRRKRRGTDGQNMARMEKRHKVPDSPASSRTTRRQSQKTLGKKMSAQFLDSPTSSRTTRNRKVYFDNLGLDNSTSGSSESEKTVEKAKKTNKKKSPNQSSAKVKEVKTKVAAIKEEKQFYAVSKILAMHVFGDDAMNAHRVFFVDWIGYPDEECWIYSEWMHTQEMVADFIEKCSLMAVVQALAGGDNEEIPDQIAKELRNDEQFIKLMQTVGKDPTKMKTSKFVFDEDITPRQKQKAMAEINDFLKANPIQKKEPTNTKNA